MRPESVVTFIKPENLMRRIQCCLMLIWVAAAVYAGPITGPAEFKRDTIAEFQVKAKGSLIVTPPPGLDVKQTASTWYVAGKPGVYKFTGQDFWVDFEARKSGVEPFDVTFTILPADGKPDPGPGPGPDPGPTPDPAVRTNPFTDDLPHVLILWDPFGPALTLEQTIAKDGQETREAIRAFCGEGNYRIWPKGQASKDAVWASAMQRLPTSYPWIMAGKGKLGYEGPLNTVQDVKNAIAKTVPAARASLDVPHAPPVLVMPTATVPASSYFTFPSSMRGSAPSCTTYRDFRGRLVTVCP